MNTTKKSVSLLLVLLLVFGMLGCFAMSASAAVPAETLQTTAPSGGMSLAGLSLLGTGENLTPATVYAYSDGTSGTDPSPAGKTVIAELSKTAVRTASDTWQISLNVTPKKNINSAPLYMEFCLDVSLSMDYDTSDGSTTRIKALKSAMNEVLDVLATTDANVYVHITTFAQNTSSKLSSSIPGYEASTGFVKIDTSNVNQIKEVVNKLSTSSGTNISAALDKSYDVITNSNIKGIPIFVMMGDGAPSSDSNRPASDTKSYPSNFWAAGVTSYSITLGIDEWSGGDMFLRSIAGNPQYNADGTLITSPTDSAYYMAGGLPYNDTTSEYYIADKASIDGGKIKSDNSTDFSVTDDNIFKYDDDNHFATATSAELAAAFREIANRSVAMVLDPAGSGFGEIAVQSVNGKAVEIDEVLNWTPSGTTLTADETYSIVYDVKLDKDTVDMTGHETDGEFTGQALNGDTKLRISNVDTKDINEILFPLPEAEYTIADLQVRCYYDTISGTPFYTESVKAIVDGSTPESFGFVPPDFIATEAGTYTKLSEDLSKYQGEDYSVYKTKFIDSKEIPTGGVHTLDLVYTIDSNSEKVQLSSTVSGKGGIATFKSADQADLVNTGGPYSTNYPTISTDKTKVYYAANDISGIAINGIGSAVLEIEPDYGYRVASVTVTSPADSDVTLKDENDNDITSSYYGNKYGDQTVKVGNITVDTVITVTFAPLNAIVVSTEVWTNDGTSTTQSATGGSITPTTRNTLEGDYETFTAIPATDYVVENVELINVPANATLAWDSDVDPTAITVKDIKGNVTVKVTFKPDNHKYSYSKYQGTGDIPTGAPESTPTSGNDVLKLPSSKTIQLVPGIGTYTDTAGVFGDADKTYTDPDTTPAVKLTSTTLTAIDDPTAPEGYVFVGWKQTEDDDDNVILTAYYLEDKVGTNNDPDTSDGVPDAVQKKVTYKVVNGYWNNEKTDNNDVVEYVTLTDTSGNWSTTGSGKLAVVPAVIVPDEAHTADQTWDCDGTPAVAPQNNDEVSGMTPTVFTVSFNTLQVFDIVYKSGTNDTSTGLTYTDKKTFDVSVKLRDFDEVDFARTGYHIVGWSKNEDGSTKDYNLEEIYNENAALTLYPVWHENTVFVTYNELPGTPDEPTGEPEEKVTDTLYSRTITIDPNGGKYNDSTDVYGPETLTGDFTVNDPVAPEGKVFAGWEKTEDADGNITLKAYYFDDIIGTDPDDPEKSDSVPDIYQVKVTYEIVGGSWDNAGADTDDKYEYVTLFDDEGNWSKTGIGKVANVPATENSVADATHQGTGVWEDVTPVNAVTLVDKDTNTTFKYVYKDAKTYTVTYNKGANGTGAVEADTKVYNVDLTLSSERFTRTGFTQIGWAEADGGTKIYDLGGTYAANADEELFPVWEAGKVTVAYNEYQDNGNQAPEPGATVTDAGKTLTVKPNGGTYKGSTSDYGPTELEADVDVEDPIAPDKKVFIGWKVTEDAGNVTLEAQYADDDDENGIPDAAEKTVTYTIQNGTWDGVNDTANKTENIVLVDADGNWDVNGSATLKAVPTGMRPTPVYNAESGTWSQVGVGSAVDLKNGFVVAAADFGAADHITYQYAYNNEAQYTVTYLPGAFADLRWTISKDYPKMSQSVTIRAYENERTGYTQVGWSLTDNGTLAYEAGDTYGETLAERIDLTLYPVWQAKALTVDFHQFVDADKDGYADQLPTAYTTENSKYDKEVVIDAKAGLYDGVKTKTVTLSENLQVADADAPAGYIFVGWEPYFDVYGDLIRLNAKYERDEVGSSTGSDGIPDSAQKKVTYVIENGTWNGADAEPVVEYVTLWKDGIVDGTWDVNGSGKLANAPTGMQADGAYKSDSGAWDVVPAPESGVTEVTGNASIVYTYTFGTLKTYTVTYDKGANGTGTIDPGTKTHGVDYTLTSLTFARDGFTQSGWAADADDGVLDYDLNDVYGLNDDITLYPVWVSHPVTIFYDEFVDDNDDVYPDNLPRATSAIVESGMDLVVNPNGGTYTDTEGIFGTPGASYTDPQTKTLTNNETIAQPTPPAGKMFIGWDKVVNTDPLVNTVLLTAIYADDANNNNIPDDVEITVTYKVENGTWDGVSATDRTENLVLKNNGKWALAEEDGTAQLAAVPEGMVAAENYQEVGAWDEPAPANGITVSESKTYTYTFILKQYTVTLDPGTYGIGTASSETKNVDENYAVTGSSFTRTGYTQTGWAITDGGDKVYDKEFTYVGKKDITLYPVWTPDDLKVEYLKYLDENENGIPDKEPVPGETPAKYDNTLTVDPNGGTYQDTKGDFGDVNTVYSEPVSKVLTENEVITKPVAPENKVFVGWQSITDAKGNVTLRAVYVDDEHGVTNPDQGDNIPDAVQKVVTFRVVNGTWEDSETADIVTYVTMEVAAAWSDEPTAVGTIADVPENMIPDAAHKAPGSWDKVVTDGMEVTGTEPVLYTYTFTEASTFTVAYDKGEGEGTIASGTKTYDVDYDLTNDVFTRTGYTQVGWATTLGGEKVYDLYATYTENKDVTLYPVWEADAVKVDYQEFIDENNDEIPDGPPADETADTFAGKTITVDPNGGKYVDTAGTFGPVNEEYNTAVNKTLTGDEVIVAPVPATDYIFVGWEKVEDEDGNITLTARYEKDVKGDDPADIDNPDDVPDNIPDSVQKKVVYQIVNGTWDGVSDNTAKSEYVTLKDKDGNWSVLGSGKLANVPGTNSAAPNAGYENNPQWIASDDSVIPGMNKTVSGTETVTYTYVYGDVVTYDVIYKGDSNSTGSVDAGIKVHDSAYALSSTTFARTGYTQTGWATEVNGDKVYNLGQTYTDNADLTLYPVWEPNDVKITFNEDVPASEVPQKTTDNSKYDRTLTINPNGGTYNDTKENTVVTLTEDITVKDPVAPENEVFVGWKEEVAGDGNVTLTAQYAPDVNGDKIPDTVQKVVTYKVVNGTWDSAGNDNADKTEYVTLWNDAKTAWDVNGKGQLAEVPAAGYPDKAHQGDGTWTAETPVNGAEVTGIEAVTYTCTFATDKTYVITYEPGANGQGTVINDTKTYDVPYTMKGADAAITREGYKIVGWTKTDGSTKDFDLAESYELNEALTVYPVWEEIELDLTYNEFPDENQDNTPDESPVEKKDTVKYGKKLTVNPNGGTYAGTTAPTETTLTENTKVDDAVAPAGKVFTGWQKDVDYLGNVTLTAQYAPDVNGDKIPDTVQKKVTYKIVNGTWGESGNADIVEYVTLFDNDGNWNEDGKGTLTQVPDNMRPVQTAANGRWVNSIPANSVVTGADPVNYTYTYEYGADPVSGSPIVTFTGNEDVDKDGNLDQSRLEVKKGATVTADLNGGNWDIVGWTKNADGTWNTVAKKNIDVPDPQREGYEFGGWAVTGPDADGNVRLTALWYEVETKVEIKVEGDLADGVKADPESLESTAQSIVEQELADGNNLMKVEVIMTVKTHTMLTPTAVSSGDPVVDAIEAIAEGRELIYYDITIEQRVTYAVWKNGAWIASEPIVTPITETPEAITVELPFDDTGKQNFAAYRYHEGEGASVLGLGSKNQNKDGEFFTMQIGSFDVHVKKFSTFAIGYIDNGTSVPGALEGEAHNSYILGRDDGLIHPQSNLTRAEAATIFFRLLKDEYRTSNLTKENSYTDIKANAWYCTAISTLSKMGILKGDSNGTFRPNDNITRAEFAAIAHRFDGKASTGSVSFNDIAGHWAADEISRAAELGWVSGFGDGNFYPNYNITRAEAITLVNNVTERKPQSVDALLPGMNVWPDNTDVSAWYYLAIQEATTSHEFSRNGDGTETWTALKANPDWSKLEK